jgi:hypothetical protein
MAETWIKSVKIVIILFTLITIALIPLEYEPSLAASSSNITLNSTVEISFPDTMTFNIKAQSNVNVTQLRLHYIVNKQKYAEIVSEGWAIFEPAESVAAQWVWDMRKSPLPMSTQVQYWWSALDASGQMAQTEVDTVVFDDTRFRWQQITEGPVTILWYSGSSSFANVLMQAAQEGLQRITDDTGTVPQEKVKIYIYASTQDLQSAQLFAPSWEGGVTFPGYNVIAISVSTVNLSFGQRAVPHELTHWIIEQITSNSYRAGLPTWLSEGLATYGEGSLSSNYQQALNVAIQNDQLLSVRSLSSPFSAIPSVAHTSYGESDSIVSFLIQSYGKEKMRELLEIFHLGSTHDDALIQVYGFDQDGLDAIWKKSLGL